LATNAYRDVKSHLEAGFSILKNELSFALVMIGDQCVANTTTETVKELVTAEKQTRKIVNGIIRDAMAAYYTTVNDVTPH
jgi:hypothetical protein